MRPRLYKVTCAITNGKVVTHLQSGLFETAEQAKDFADRLFDEGIIVGYRVSYSLDGGNSFYFHEYVKHEPFANDLELVRSSSYCTFGSVPPGQPKGVK